MIRLARRAALGLALVFAVAGVPGLAEAGVAILQGRVVDSNGRPVGQFPVTVRGEGANQGTTYAAVTDSAGRFEIGQVDPGTYVVAPANAPAAARRITVRGPESRGIYGYLRSLGRTAPVRVDIGVLRLSWPVALESDPQAPRVA